MFVVWALAASAMFGLADLAGGMAGRQARLLPVVWWSQATGLALIAVLAPVLGPNEPSATSLGWGVLAGSTSIVGISLLYGGLARGRMGVVSPTAAVVGVLVPATVGLASGETLRPLGWLGVILALPAVVLIAAVPDSAARLTGRRGPALGGLWWGIGAGIGIGGFLVFISRPPTDAGQWPLLAARSTSVTVIALAVLVAGLLRGGGSGRAGTAFAVPRSARGLVAAAGGLDISANAAFVVAERNGPLTVVSVLAGLYPVATLVGARVLLDETFSRRQLSGLVLGAASIIALSIT